MEELLNGLANGSIQVMELINWQGDHSPVVSSHPGLQPLINNLHLWQGDGTDQHHHRQQHAMIGQTLT
jgi:hypothetical protein